MHSYLYQHRTALLSTLRRALAAAAYNLPAATVTKLLRHLDTATVTLGKLRSPGLTLTAMETRAMQEAHWSLTYCANHLGLTSLADELNLHSC